MQMAEIVTEQWIQIQKLEQAVHMAEVLVYFLVVLASVCTNKHNENHYISQLYNQILVTGANIKD